MDKFHYLLIGIILVLFIYFNSKISTIEKMSNTDATTIREAVKEVYKADVIALKNIGDVASSLLSSDKKKLTLPFDEVEITGDLNVKKNIGLNGDIRFTGGNNWTIHTPDDNRKSLYITPSTNYGKQDWNWPNSMEFNGGSLHVKNDITYANKLGHLQNNANDGANITLKNKHNKNGIQLFSMYGNTSSRALFNDKDGNNKTDIYNHDLKVPNLYTENIGKHQGDGWLRINNIGNSAAIALHGTLSINEHKGKGGLNVGSWNEKGVGNGQIYATSQVNGGSLRSRDVVYTSGGGWFRADNNHNNRVLVNGHQNG